MQNHYPINSSFQLSSDHVERDAAFFPLHTLSFEGVIQDLHLHEYAAAIQPWDYHSYINSGMPYIFFDTTRRFRCRIIIFS